RDQMARAPHEPRRAQALQPFRDRVLRKARVRDQLGRRRLAPERGEGLDERPRALALEHLLALRRAALSKHRSSVPRSRGRIKEGRKREILRLPAVSPVPAQRIPRFAWGTEAPERARARLR